MRIEKGSLFGFGLAAVVLSSGIALAQVQPAAAGDKWYSVALSDNVEAFVNTNSIRLVGTTVELRAKENFMAPKPAASKGKTFLSTRTVYRLNCAERKIAMSETRAYSGKDLQGEEVQKASRNERNLVWMDAPRATVFGEILDYGCKHAPAAAPGG
ncbi:MAG: hypothetical protein FIB04_10025 [Gammaproteobacteria bacterium]|nr:hypothetical protein [Gammaproteobacteria bacterium]